jgi:uncharacterized protein YbjT (DUF2867 family)
MTRPNILVTNAHGKTGFATALQLRAKDYPVRAFVRRRKPLTAQLEKAGAEIFVGDMGDMATLNQAMVGIQRAYFCLPGIPNPLFYGVSFAIAAQAAQLEVVVAMGQWLSQPQHPAFATRVMNLMDAVLAWMPDVDVITLNPGWFADNYMAVLGPIAQLGLMSLPLGPGLNPPPANEDIARVIVGALTDPAPHIGKTYRPTGPELLSPDQIAAIFARVLDRPVRYMDISESMFLKAMQVQGLSPFMQSQLCYFSAEYRRNTFGLGGPTDAVLALGGRPPDDFETIVRRYVSHRPEAQRSLTRKAQALWSFAQILLTPTPDVAGYERSQHHPTVSQPAYSPDDVQWLASHSLTGAFGMTQAAG